MPVPLLSFDQALDKDNNTAVLRGNAISRPKRECGNMRLKSYGYSIAGGG